MSQGDEFEAGKPRPGWQPPTGGYDNERDEPGDGADIGKPKRSGAVTAVGVVAIIIGCLLLLGSICTPLIPAISSAMLDLAQQANPKDPNLEKQRAQLAKMPPMLYLVTISVVDFCRGLVLIIGGVGVVKRKSIGRVLLLAMAALAIVMFLVGVIASFVMGTIDLSDPANIAGSIFGIGCSAVFNLGFAILAFAILLGAKNAAEFRT